MLKIWPRKTPIPTDGKKSQPFGLMNGRLLNENSENRRILPFLNFGTAPAMYLASERKALRKDQKGN
jgi:hypothetical protein